MKFLSISSSNFNILISSQLFKSSRKIDNIVTYSTLQVSINTNRVRSSLTRSKSHTLNTKSISRASRNHQSPNKHTNKSKRKNQQELVPFQILITLFELVTKSCLKFEKSSTGKVLRRKRRKIARSGQLWPDGSTSRSGSHTRSIQGWKS